MFETISLTGAGCLGIFLVIVIFLVLWAGISALIGALFMVLWNFVAASLGAPTLDFWHAWALWALIALVGSAFRSSVSSSTTKKANNG